MGPLQPADYTSPGAAGTLRLTVAGRLEPNGSRPTGWCFWDADVTDLASQVVLCVLQWNRLEIKKHSTESSLSTLRETWLIEDTWLSYFHVEVSWFRAKNRSDPFIGNEWTYQRTVASVP